MNLSFIVAIRSRFFLPIALRRSSASEPEKPAIERGDLHQLLLVDDAAVGLLGDRAQARVRVADGRGVVLALRVGGDVGHRAGPVEGAERDQVAELGRADPFQRVAHPVGLELEDAGRVAAGEHLVGLRGRRAGSRPSRSSRRASGG